MIDYLFDVDWATVLLPRTPFLEIVVRGTAVYLALFLMLRFLLKREVGSLGIADLLLLVIIADAAQNAMGDSYESITDGLLLVGTIVFWNYALDYLSYRSTLFRKIIKPPELPLVKDGRILYRNLEKEKITEDELMSAVRSHGIADLDRVRDVYIEPDGMISVLTYPNRGQESEDELPAYSKKRKKAG